ncbi:hypothetical protein [Flavivirga spongiicola]|uniref:SGNH/GDSL hydrolase family protein n=1 Tax=Flavivirga spongiicola TaxID=421621 RepID=A0ABU7XYH3_9FLAO|nr:hypothetical protein [Flavivirga sp. MEBiC05379]MDO5980490.1 hypothetical protein [Flavivirga sp. MEBiC05379]
MKKIIKLILILAIVFFITDRVVYLAIKTFDKKVFTGQSVGKVNQFLLLKDSVDLLVFGSSRANHHLDNRLLDSSSYNMGVDGTKIGYSAALIATLNKKRQNIFIHIDPDMLFDSEYKGDDISILLNLIKRNKKIDEFIFDFLPQENYLSKIFNCYAYNGKVLGIARNYIAPTYDFNNYNGYDPLYPSKEQAKIFKELKEKDSLHGFHNDSFNSSPNQLTNELINRIIIKCEENNSRLVFFTSPTLIKHKNKVKFNIREYFRGKEVKYYDFSDILDNENIGNWKDFTHLSEKGARIFSNQFKDAFY